MSAMHLEKFYVPVASAAAGDGNTHATRHEPRHLLALLATTNAATPPPVEHESPPAAVAHGRRFTDVMVYLHGFPDMAVHPTRLEMASRLPFKIAGAWLAHGSQPRSSNEQNAVAFVAFNFGGVPGSDDTLAFQDKTISHEVSDAVAVCDYVRHTLLSTSPSGRIHIVGISTGAIIGSLLRGTRPCVADTITVIAGLGDLQKGIRYDFTDSQMQQFDANGACWKEFYLPDGCALPTNAVVSLDGVHEATAEELSAVEELPRKVYFRLHRRYLDECLDGNSTLNIQRAVSCPSGSRDADACPLLVIHGDADQNVPFVDGEELFDVAAEPKSFLAIAKANHLLTNSKHLKKALQVMLAHIERSSSS